MRRQSKPEKLFVIDTSLTKGKEAGHLEDITKAYSSRHNEMTHE